MEELLEDPQSPRRSDRGGERGDRHRKTSLLILFVAFLVLIGGVVATASYYRGCKEPPGGAARTVRFTVPAGATADEVAGDLADAGLIRCGGFVGNLLMRGTGKASAIRAGTYDLTTGMTLAEVMKVLTTAPKSVPMTDVLIPPGYRITEIADAVHHAYGIPTQAFEDAAHSGRYSLAPYLPEGSSSVEGFLWPDTYRFPTDGTTPDQVIRTQLDAFRRHVENLPWDRAAKLHVTPYQVVVIASMIEKEAVLDRDRPLISAVIYNRIRLGMTLGIDATVAYIDPNPADGLTTSDFEIDSPYNTRLNPGLPPTPIASPSIASLRAALDPANVGYLYYVACGHGTHRFSVDYATFLRNKAECLG